MLRDYFRAKDENRPHVLERVFAPNAELVIQNRSPNIAFPAASRGRAAIAEVLVRTFAVSYENVYSFYLDRPSPGAREFSCAWLVGMSERSSREVRVGCGTYAWVFEPQPSGLAHRLAITIDSMQVLPQGEFERVFAWLGGLDYPWSSASSALRGIPKLESLAPIASFLGRNVATG